jgi:hypothetical protein
MSQPIVPQKTYLLVFLCLIGLTILTTGVAFIDRSGLHRPRAVQHRGCTRDCVFENAPGDFIFHGSEAQQRAGPDHPGRWFFLARSSDRLHDERLSHSLLDPRARFLVLHGPPNTPLTLAFSVFSVLKAFSALALPAMQNHSPQRTQRILVSQKSFNVSGS